MKEKQIVTVRIFDKTRKAKALVYGDLLPLYEGDNLMWIEREESWYGLWWWEKNVKDFCVLRREDFLWGEDI